MFTPHRRDALRGLTLGTGGLLLAPILSQVAAQAAGGAAAKPMRFVFVLEGNGVTPDQVQPKNISVKKNNGQNAADTLIDKPLDADHLPYALEPVKAFADRLTVIQGLSGRVCGGGHSNNFGALGVYSGKAGAAGETIDAALAKALGGIFPHVGLGISDRVEHDTIYNVSAWDAGKKLPTQCRPDLAFNGLFGSVAKGVGRQAFDAKTNLLDYMAADVRRAEGALGGDEKEKFRDHLAAYEALKDRQSKLTAVEEHLRKAAPPVTDKYRSAVETDRLDAQFDLAAAALIGGLTNVVTLSSGSGDPYFSVRFRGLGIDLDKHSIGHGGSYMGKTWAELSATIRRFHFELVARLASKLAAVKEGDGTMLDNTLIVYLSDSAESHHSRCWEWPFVILGNLGGRLKLGNRFLCYPAHGRPGHRTIANLYGSFLAAAGKPRDHFGVPDPTLKDFDQKGPLAEIM